MTNTHRNKQKGAATLVITILLLVTLTLIVLFAASYIVMRQKIAANSYRTNQALEAAEAGLEFAIPYLQQNSATILANPVSGFIPAYTSSNTQNVTLANNSKFTISYTNPVANNYNLILITVTGTSDDGTSTRTIRQMVQFGSLDATTPTSSIASKGSVSMTGSSQITNTNTNVNIVSGGAVTMSGSAQTNTQNGGSTPGNFGSDIQQNQSSLSNMTTSDFFASYFGASASQVKSSFANYYSNSSNTNYSSTLNGKTGTSIWIDQTSGQASITGSTTIGSAANPVIMVVNGDFRISGSIQFYGILYIMGDITSDITGSVQINGSLISQGNLNFTGSTQITYSSAVLNAARQANKYYAKVGGSWKDF